LPVIVFGRPLVGQFNASPVCEKLKCLAKLLTEVFLNETEAVASSATRMALVEGRGLVGHDGEGWAMVVMEWAETHVLATPGP
jgi:hypothetical protein